MNNITINIFILAAFIICQENTYAWNAEVTHKDLSRYAVDISVLQPCAGNANQQCNYLQSVGLEKGLNEELVWNNRTQIAKDWLAEGGELEDYATRWRNHFHDPLTPWLTAGLTDLWSGQSALLWAQCYDGSQQPMADDWSWQRTRKLYHLALTSTDADVRSMFFAETFRGIGQQMHLLQDMAVPAHVRNDAHPLDAIVGNSGNGSFFETWVATNKPDLKKLKGFAPNPIIPQLVFSAPTDNGVTYTGLAPITQLFDTNQYDGSNPSTTDDRGLTEYTNANFFSDDTINLPNAWLSDGHSFPHPNAGSTNLQDYINNSALPSTIIAEDGVADLGFWIKKTGDEPIEHFVKPGYSTNHLYDILGGGYVYYTTFVLDDKCHQDYAEKLLPRAVGYSAALLDYFFRGQLGVSLVPGGMKVKNLSDEAMSSGAIGVYYDDANNVRHPLQTYDMASSSLAPGQVTPVINFNTPVNPPNIKTSRYIIVFKGKLGNEEDAVIGKVYSPMLYYFATIDGMDKIMGVNTAGGVPFVVADTDDPNVWLGRISPSPDGKALAFGVFTPSQDENNGTIYQVNLTTGITTYLTTGNSPDWSPDGQNIVFSRELGRVTPWADEQLFTRNLATGSEIQLTNVPYSSSLEPVWSPDGDRIAYARFNSDKTNCSNDYTINVMTSSGTADNRVTCQTAGAYIDREPAWSPDGNEFAFVRKKDGMPYSELHKVNVATKQVVKLTDSNGTNFNEYSPAWSPDGLTIAAGSTRDGDYDIWLVDAQGVGNPQNLTNVNGAADGFPIFGK